MKRDRAREIVRRITRYRIAETIEGFHIDDAMTEDWRKDILRLSRPRYDDRRLHHTTSRPIRQHVRKSRARG